ncbi:uncharacterized protein LOC143021129 [Oratosquilla oratoria]|uniref:uncharacterized protein LOC143021129 n=1 Tax=Oratosquilla oratoria TaxID=337810 RepID=UPI003F769A97
MAKVLLTISSLFPVPDHFRPRVCSLPEKPYNPRDGEELYRLRSFSITSKGVINRGDSLISRRSRSNTSVCSTVSRLPFEPTLSEISLQSPSEQSQATPNNSRRSSTVSTTLTIDTINTGLQHGGDEVKPGKVSSTNSTPTSTTSTTTITTPGGASIPPKHHHHHYHHRLHHHHHHHHHSNITNPTTIASSTVSNTTTTPTSNCSSNSTQMPPFRRPSSPRPLPFSSPGTTNRRESWITAHGSPRISTR